MTLVKRLLILIVILAAGCSDIEKYGDEEGAVTTLKPRHNRFWAVELRDVARKPLIQLHVTHINGSPVYVAVLDKTNFAIWEKIGLFGSKCEAMAAASREAGRKLGLSGRSDVSLGPVPLHESLIASCVETSYVSDWVTPEWESIQSGPVMVYLVAENRSKEDELRARINVNLRRNPDR